MLATTEKQLETVLRHPAIWRAQAVEQAVQGLPTSYPALDQVLPDSGWPPGALTELLVNVTGAGELSLLLPALRAICTGARADKHGKQGDQRGIALLGTPYLPQPRAWEAAGIPLERMLIVEATSSELLWSAEQILRSGECGAVLVWGQAAGRALNHRALQRLHLAAGIGNAACFLYRSFAAESSPSPAPLRLRLTAQAGGLHLHIVKCRGMACARPVAVQLFPAHWNDTPAQVTSAAPSPPLKVATPQQHYSVTNQLSLV